MRHMAVEKMGLCMIEAAEKCPDARRVAPIRACVFYQIDRLKSGFEAVERTVIPGNCALMGATRLASSIFQQPRPASFFFSSLMIIPNGLHTVFCDFAILSALYTFCMHCVDNQTFQECRHHLHTTTLVCTLFARCLHSG